METIKAGCYLINTKNKQVALVFRKKHNDYSFPKGHLEKNETITECAIRETAEETKRVAIISNLEPLIEKYETPKSEKCICYMFYATDGGPSNNTSKDTHPTVWVDIEEVEKILTYDSSKLSWKEAKENIKKLI